MSEQQQEEENIIFTETNNTKIPIEDVIILADNIWKDIKSSQLNEDQKMETYYSKYNTFAGSFPIVLKWMIQMNSYNKSAFKKFLYKYNNTTVNDKTSFLTLQAEYLVYVYRESKHVTTSQINTYRNCVVKQLLDEDKEFEEIQEQIKQEKDSERRKNIYNYLKSIN